MTGGARRVEHAAKRQHENAAERGFRGGLPETAWRLEPSRCHSSLDVVGTTWTDRADDRAASRSRIFRRAETGAHSASRQTRVAPLRGRDTEARGDAGRPRDRVTSDWGSGRHASEPPQSALLSRRFAGAASGRRADRFAAGGTAIDAIRNAIAITRWVRARRESSGSAPTPSDGCASRAEHRVGGLRVHRVQDAVNRFVAARSRRSLRRGSLRDCGIDDDLHQPLRLTFFDRASDASHWPLPDQRFAPRVALRSVSRRARAAGRCRARRPNAIGDAASGAVEQVGGDDLVVVVRRVGERAFTVAVAERPDAWNVRREPIVHDNVAALVACHARGVESRDRRYSASADGEEQMRALDRWAALLAIDMRP